MLDDSPVRSNRSWEERVTTTFSTLSVVSLLCYIMFSDGLIYYFSIIGKLARKLLPVLS